MKKPTILKKFEYSILPSVITLAGNKKQQIVPEHLPLSNVVIDFQRGSLSLKGDWDFMLSTNTNNELAWLDYHTERVQIEAIIHASSMINLDDSENDGLVFQLSGSINDGISIFSCSGLLALANVRKGNELISDQWNISLSLYDLDFYGCQINFRIPIFMADSNANNN